MLFCDDFRGQFERTPLYRAAFAGNLAAAQVDMIQIPFMRSSGHKYYSD